MAGNKKRQRSDRLRLGYVPLNDCAPLIMARELGLFAKHGLHVELTREVGWATIRDKIIYGELDAAHALAGMLLAATFGIGSIRAECLTGLVLNLHGNAITLSSRLRREGVRDGATLRDYVKSGKSTTPLTFGAVFPFSSHNFLLRHWLGLHGIDPERDVRIVIVPPPQMARNLRAGHLDGYCVGEPWNSLSVLTGTGFCVAPSAELAPGHVEKVLMVRRSFAEERGEEHGALIAALYEACRFCDSPENRERVTEVLASPAYLGTPIRVLQMSMMGTFNFGGGRIEKIPEFNLFFRNNTNVPSRQKAESVLRQMITAKAVPDPELISPDAAAVCFREDIFLNSIQSIL